MSLLVEEPADTVAADNKVCFALLFTKGGFYLFGLQV